MSGQLFLSEFSYNYVSAAGNLSVLIDVTILTNSVAYSSSSPAILCTCSESDSIETWIEILLVAKKQTNNKKVDKQYHLFFYLSISF